MQPILKRFTQRTTGLGQPLDAPQRRTWPTRAYIASNQFTPTQPKPHQRAMNRTLTVLTVVLLLAFAGYFVGNRVVASRASAEIERLAGPKLHELGIAYSELSVNPAGGTLTLTNVAFEEAYAEALTVGADHKDLIALMSGETMFLNGLDVALKNARVSDNRGREGVEVGSAQLEVDALLDLELFKRNPEQFIERLFDQENVHVAMEGTDLVIRTDDLTRDLGLDTESVRLSEWGLHVDKDDLLYDVRMRANAPDLGRIDLEARGTEHLLSYAKGSLSNVDLATDAGSLSLGNGTFEVIAPLPMQDPDDWSDSWFEAMLAQGQTFNWAFNASNLEIGSPEMVEMARQVGLSGGILNVQTLSHNASFGGNTFLADLKLRSNAGDADADVNVAMDDYRSLDNPETVHFNTLELEFRNLLPFLSEQLRAMGTPLQPNGPNGFSFSFEGSAAELEAAYNL